MMKSRNFIDPSSLIDSSSSSYDRSRDESDEYWRGPERWIEWKMAKCALVSRCIDQRDVAERREKRMKNRFIFTSAKSAPPHQRFFIGNGKMKREWQPAESRVESDGNDKSRQYKSQL